MFFHLSPKEPCNILPKSPTTSAKKSLAYLYVHPVFTCTHTYIFIYTRQVQQEGAFICRQKSPVIYRQRAPQLPQKSPVLVYTRTHTFVHTCSYTPGKVKQRSASICRQKSPVIYRQRAPHFPQKSPVFVYTHIHIFIHTCSYTPGKVKQRSASIRRQKSPVIYRQRAPHFPQKSPYLCIHTHIHSCTHILTHQASSAKTR